MDWALKLALVTAALAVSSASGTAAAQAGLSYERAGLGLRPQAGVSAMPAEPVIGSEAAHVWQTRRSSDYALYGGTRELPHLGLRAAESFGGVIYSLSGSWGSSIEAGVQESPLSQRRYALTGQLHASFDGGRSLSVGMKYRARDSGSMARSGMPDDVPPANGYTLAPLRPYGGAVAPSYQLQMSYQYGAASTFGLALGREVETFTPFYDLQGSGPRQFSLTGHHWLTPSWALSYDVMSPDVATPLRLHSLRLGVRYRF